LLGGGGGSAGGGGWKGFGGIRGAEAGTGLFLGCEVGAKVGFKGGGSFKSHGVLGGVNGRRREWGLVLTSGGYSRVGASV